MAALEYVDIAIDKDYTDTDYPDGWPRVAAFLNGCNSFGIYRRFGQCHSRLLVTHMANITDIERQLSDLDKADEAGEATKWRLKTRYHEEGFDTTKRDLLEKLEKELAAYGMLFLIASGIYSSEPELTISCH
jgi:hypothetical protein